MNDSDTRTVHINGRALTRDEMLDLARALGTSDQEFAGMWEDFQAGFAEHRRLQALH